jgi:hypothetical protein
MDCTALLMLIIVILIFVGAVWFWRVASLVSDLPKNVLVIAPMTFRPKM